FVPGVSGSVGLFALRWFATLVAYFSGCAGGVFAPSLAIGGVIGSYLDGFLHSGNPNLMILLGMAAFLSGVTRAPFTAFVLVVEMTDLHSSIFPLMLAAAAATVAAHVVDGTSFYHRHARVFSWWFHVAAPPWRS